MLSIAWRIARRELRSGIRGFRVFLLCLATGVAAISAIGSLSSALTEGMRADARKILGGDVDSDCLAKTTCFSYSKFSND